jgi:hypothetical protein
MARVFACLAELATEVPAYDLSFVPSEDVWSFIDEEVP